METTRKPFIVCLSVTLASVLGVLAQTPSNDNFDNRTVLMGSVVTITGSLAGATRESDEYDPAYVVNPPYSNNPRVSVWWSWAAPTSSIVVISMGTVSHNSVAVYSGTNLTSLSMKAGSSSPKPPGRYLRFDAIAGATYQIQVIGTETQPFSMQLIATNPPVFIFQPQDCTVSPYGSAIFSALATGPTPPSGYPSGYTYRPPATSYQWLFNGIPLPGQTFPSLLVHGVTTNQAGTYSVVASNVGGITQGGSALLTVAETNPVPGLAVLPPSNPASLQFTLRGEPGRWYKIQSSTNLHDWTNPSRLLLTNPTVSISIQRIAPAHYVRGSLDVPTEVCVAQLKQMKWAMSIWSIENKIPESFSCSIPDMKTYLPVSSNVFAPFCPAGGTYSALLALTSVPTCTIVGHVMSEYP